MSVTDEGTAIRSRTRAGLARLAGPWWIFLLTGIAWLILSWVALRFAPASIPTVGILLGFLFAFGAGWSFVQPYNAFWALASILGLLLVFRGTLDIITSASTREVNSVWWLGMVVGILEIFLGFWASQQYRPVQGALLLIWIGFFALFRGISEIVIAFELRRAQHP